MNPAFSQYVDELARAAGVASPASGQVESTVSGLLDRGYRTSFDQKIITRGELTEVFEAHLRNLVGELPAGSDAEPPGAGRQYLDDAIEQLLSR